MSDLITTRKNYNGIDIAKFILSLSVIALHYSPFGSTDNTLLQDFNFIIQKYLTRIAVPFFFIASGFFLYQKISKEKDDNEPVRSYLGKIFRLYILWSIIYSPIIIYGIFKDDKGIMHSLLRLARDLLFVGSYVQLWYLYALIIAIILISYMLHKKIKPNTILFISFIFYFIGLFGNSWHVFLLPLKDTAPLIWNIFHITKKVIYTTRNGLFMGFFFVSIGMCFAYNENSIEKKKAIVGFFVSMIMLAVEVFFLKHYYSFRNGDMFIFLIPASYFLFAYCKQVNLQNKKIFKTLRIMSSLIFYTHTWVGFVVLRITKTINKDLRKTCINYLLITLITLLLSYFIYRLSLKEKYKFLQNIYS